MYDIIYGAMKNTEGKTALTFGVFDLLHYGHFELFKQIKDMVGESGRVVVALQQDEWVGKFKDVRLVYSFEMRKEMIETLRTVDKVIGYDVVGVKVLEENAFDVLVVGPEHTSERFQTCFEWCRRHGREVVVMPRTEGISTTKLKQILKSEV